MLPLLFFLQFSQICASPPCTLWSKSCLLLPMCAELITQMSNYGVLPNVIFKKKQVMKQYVSGFISRRGKAAAVSHCISSVTVSLQKEKQQQDISLPNSHDIINYSTPQDGPFCSFLLLTLCVTGCDSMTRKIDGFMSNYTPIQDN